MKHDKAQNQKERRSEQADEIEKDEGKQKRPENKKTKIKELKETGSEKWKSRAGQDPATGPRKGEQNITQTKTEGVAEL